MKHSLKTFLTTDLKLPEPFAEHLSGCLAEHICSPEFTARHRQRILFLPDFGLGETINSKWRTAMSAFTDAMTALGQKIAANTSAGDAAHLQAIDDHLGKLDAQAGTDEAAEADTQAGLQALLAAANGTPTGTTAPTPVPTPAPTAAPAS